ncbi:hypothetical protein EGW08_000818, partial [Elysia chlorotica]
MDGIRDANHYILAGMNIAYQVQQRASMERHLARDRRRKGWSRDDAAYLDRQQTEAAALLDGVKSRNFTEKLKRMTSEEDEFQLFAASIYSLQSSALHTESEVSRVRGLFRGRDFYRSLRDLREYLTDAIRTLNRNFLEKPALRRLRYQKRLTESARDYLGLGEDMLRNSYTALRSSMSNQKENRRLVGEWVARGRGPGPAPSLKTQPNSGSNLRMLSLRVKSCRLHSRRLREGADRELRVLKYPASEARKFLSGPRRQGAVYMQLQPLARSLQSFIPDMYAAL